MDDIELKTVHGGQQVAIIHLSGEMPVRVSTDGEHVSTNGETTQVVRKSGGVIDIRQS